MSGTAKTVKNLTRARLVTQVNDGVIKSFDENTLSVTDLGDTLRVNVSVAVVEPINFININAEIRRFATTE